VTGSLDIAAAAGRLSAAAAPLLVAHVRPDGDAIGSVVGLWHVLRDLGRRPTAVFYEDIPPRYAFVAEGVPIIRWGRDLDAPRAGGHDLVCILDTCSFQQLEPIADFLKSTRPRLLVVDHHKTRDAVADAVLIDEHAAATAQMVLGVCEAGGWPVSRRAAEALFVGLGTDTGWFRVSNTTPAALEAAAKLARLGANPSELYERIYLSDPAARVRLIARVLSELKLVSGDRVAVQTLTRRTLADCGATDAMTEEIVNEPMRIATVNVSIFCSESPDNGPIRVNLRSKRDIDVAVLAQQFGGGGHARAAGARVPGTLEDVVARVTAAVLAELK
jgi:phosphoesterase RecJ-like protein